MRSIIFCQAPLKVTATLNCYEEELNKGNDIDIVITNVKSIYDFFKLLNLNAHLHFFEPWIPSIYTNIWKFKNKINGDIAELNVKDPTATNVFFTDSCDDIYIGVYLQKLSNCRIYKIQMQLDHCLKLDEFVYCTNVPFKLRIKKILLSLFLGVKYIFKKIDHWTFALDIQSYGYQCVDFSDTSIQNRYKIPVPIDNPKIVLLFTEPYRNHYQSEQNYMYVHKLIFDQLHKKGYAVVVKGHPRIGCLDLAIKLSDYEIPQYVPAEFLDLSKFAFTIGFVSTSVCNAAKHILSYSVLPLCEVADPNEQDYWYNYMQNNSENKVVFLDNWDSIPSLL